VSGFDDRSLSKTFLSFPPSSSLGFQLRRRRGHARLGKNKAGENPFSFFFLRSGDELGNLPYIARECVFKAFFSTDKPAGVTRGWIFPFASVRIDSSSLFYS
jgi:hypothetical protein